MCRAHARHVVALAFNGDDRRVFENAAAEILQRPCVGLQGAVRIGVAAEMIVVARQHVIARERHEFPNLLRVQEVSAQSIILGFVHDFFVE